MSTQDHDERSGDDVELNPQPIPPGHQEAMRHSRPGDQVELNPQPIPPGRGWMGALRRSLRRVFGGRTRQR
jgi:hypothetical protein